MSEIEVRVPDLGDTKAGDRGGRARLASGQRFGSTMRSITLESEKASMDIPSSVAGTIASIAVKKGQEVSSGTVIATLTTSEE